MSDSTSIYQSINWTNPQLAAQYLPEPFSNKSENIQSIIVQDMSDAGGMSGEMSRLVVKGNNGDSAHKEEGVSMSFVLKTTKPQPQSQSMSKNLGLYREAIFYKKCVGTLFDATVVPEVYCAEWDPSTGRKCMLMEDLGNSKAVQSGYFFGEVSFLNQGKDLAALTAEYPTTSEWDVCKMAFSIAAKLHGGSWGCSKEKNTDDAAGGVDLLSKEFSFLKGQLWLTGQDKVGWETSKNHAASVWKSALAKKAVVHSEDALPGDEPIVLHNGVKYDEAVINFMQTVLLDSTFEDYVASVQPGSLTAVIPTLTHGDFHPGNFMVVKKKIGGDEGPEEQVELKVLDFEVMGVGSGPQDLGQFMISHSSPTQRRKNEAALLSQYHNELCDCILKNGGDEATLPTLEYVTREYVLGGLGRWAWLLGVCAGVCPPPMNQIFNDQLVSFLQDHNEALKGVKVFPRP